MWFSRRTMRDWHPRAPPVPGRRLRGIVDIVFAARQLDPGIGRRWAVMGHSQGGHAALFTASMAHALAPDLDLIGAVAIAPAGSAHDMIGDLRASAPGLSFLTLALIGAAAADRAVRLDRLLTPAAHPGRPLPAGQSRDRRYRRPPEPRCMVAARARRALPSRRRPEAIAQGPDGQRSGSAPALRASPDRPGQ
jgi:Secretory lipase